MGLVERVSIELHSLLNASATSLLVLEHDTRIVSCELQELEILEGTIFRAVGKHKGQMGQVFVELISELEAQKEAVASLDATLQPTAAARLACELVTLLQAAEYERQEKHALLNQIEQVSDGCLFSHVHLSTFREQ